MTLSSQHHWPMEIITIWTIFKELKPTWGTKHILKTSKCCYPFEFEKDELIRDSIFIFRSFFKISLMAHQFLKKRFNILGNVES